MKNLIFVFIAALFFSAGSRIKEDDVKGIWYNTEKTSKIKIFLATDGKYYGKIVWMTEPEKKDINNPNETKHTNPVMGMQIINHFTFDTGELQWSGGTIYDPDNGKTYDCYMWFDENNTDLLHVKGYVMGMKFVGREVEWTRTEL
jgi:uncharacterized protein (DUF2147 family)